MSGGLIGRTLARYRIDLVNAMDVVSELSHDARPHARNASFRCTTS